MGLRHIPRANRGFALIALLAILTAGILYFVVGQFDATAAQQRKEALQRDMDKLVRDTEALLRQAQQK